MRYLLKIDGKPVKKGDLIRDFRNKQWKFLEVTLFGKRVYVEELEERNGRHMTCEFFPTVFKATIEEVHE